jgi:hypothetical protein
MLFFCVVPCSPNPYIPLFLIEKTPQIQNPPTQQSTNQQKKNSPFSRQNLRNFSYTFNCSYTNTLLTKN